MTEDTTQSVTGDTKRSLGSKAAPIVALVFGLIVSSLVSLAIRQSEESAAHGRADAIITQTQTSANFALGVRFNSVRRLADRWQAVGGIPLDYWNAEAELTVQGLPDVLCMMLMSADGRIQSQQTRSGVEPKSPEQIFATKYGELSFQEKFDLRQLLISLPFPDANGFAVLIGAPLFKSDQFDGYVLAAFAPGELLGSFLADIRSAGYAVSIQQDKQTIYDGLLPQTVTNPIWGRQAPIQFGANQWQIRVTPTQQRLDEMFSGLPAFIMIGSVLISLTIAYGIDRSMRIERADRQLRTSNQKLQTALRHQTALAEDLKAERDRADHSSQLKSEFLANMSHEIRTPMNAVIGFSQLLEKSDLPDPQSEWARTIRSSGEDLLTLLNSILEFSRIESGQIEINLASCQLEDLFTRTQHLWAKQANEKGIQLDFEISPSVPQTIQTDESILRQIIFNLVSNAVKFTDQGGVGVKLDTLKQPGKGSAVLRCSVKDTGIGIDEKHHARLFDKFTQGDGSLNRKHGGTGLGLALSKSLAQLLGGDLSFESQPNKGSIFYFDFPYRVEESEIENSSVYEAFSEREKSIA